ncbi:MAG: HD domain-containing protein [Methanolinea sp.]|nr:HD domain-containing protein [Methanolinea sp.]
MGAKIIKDPVHGYVEVEGPFLPLLDSRLVQRLRHVRQLGFSYLVYPGAHHTRFEHSLGTMHLAGIMARQLGLPGRTSALVRAAALLHDVGHGPFSHAFEPLAREYLGRHHHDVADLLASGEIRGALGAMGIGTDEVVSLIRGTHPLSGIIHGELDVDRMDYLLRDAHYTGAPYGTVDAHRLIRNTFLMDGRLVLAESGVNAAESLLIARTLMRPSVYFHHVSRIGEMMFQAAVMAHVEDDPAGGLSALLSADDSACMQALLSSENVVARDLALRIYERRLYKRALWVGRDRVNTARMARCTSHERRREVGERIAAEAGIDPSLVMVDIPPFPSEMSLPVQVSHQKRAVPLSELSPLLHTLNETRKGQWRLGVYTPAEYREEVGEIAAEVLHVKPATTQEPLFPDDG